MADLNGIYVGKGDIPVVLLPKYANRHGLIAGATGTGKTVTLQTLAEGLSSLGTSVFMADVKGDLAGLSQIGGGNPKLDARAAQIGLDPYEHSAFPVIFWDVFGEQGHPVRATVSEMGPLLLSRLLQLNEVQEGVLNVVFKVADERGLLLLDMKDLRSMLNFVADNAAEFRAEYGNVTSTTVGTIQRQLLVLEEQGADKFFGEPALQLSDLIRTTNDGRGIVNILAADKLMQSPRLYATFLLWMLSELWETLPEVGDLPQPKLVFFFDEAHLLFDEAPQSLLEKIEQVVRLIRSKGVGVFFVTQHPLDIPDSVSSQLSNRVQHALRAFTPRDQKAVSTAADTFRQNPKFETKDVITNMVVGEALVSMLGADGAPTVVERTLIKPPGSRLGPVVPAERQAIIQKSPIFSKYEETLDSESAYEVLLKRQQEAQQAAEDNPEPEKAPARRSDTVVESVIKSTMRAAGSQLGRQVMRGILGGILGGIFGRKRR
ncbi:MAG: DUF853 domain-containing protein [Armatimonadetes bacterium]|nr:DUF853 domain-containing protein [Armatimonadota bacterium]